MADYRELLRKAIDALPDNTGANRRAVYEKARTALVAQLRAIDPPLPAREITTHRLALEDCIREVEHEATEKLLGRFKAVEDAPAEEPTPEPVLEAEPDFAERQTLDEDERLAATPDAFPQEPEIADDSGDARGDGDDETQRSEPEAPVVEDDRIEPENNWAPMPFDADQEPETVEPESVALQPAEQDPESPATDIDDDLVADGAAPGSSDPLATIDDIIAGTQPPSASRDDDTSYATGSIEDIIASAERSSAPVDETGEADSASREDARVIPFVAPYRSTGEPAPGDRHFMLHGSEADEPSGAPLVDSHGQPLRPSAESAAGAPETAMSSVREVDLEPGLVGSPEISDAQVAIDRAIAALDREARGENHDDDGEAGNHTGEQGPPVDDEAPRGGPSGSGFGALTIFLVIAVLLLGGGGIAGYWAWREGYVDLNSVFANGGPEQPATEVAEADPDIEAFEDDASPAQTSTTPPAANTTPDVPAAGEGVTGLPGEQAPSSDTVTPSTTPVEPEVAFEDRLPAEAGSADATGDEPADQSGIALTSEGAQSLLLEEQSGGTTGAVPYSGSVEWSRGTDEVGNPTIVADATIPARNLDVTVLIRRNGDANLPASHLMEVNFTVAESFVGGSISNLPGVLLKDQELVQGQPLAGASARIVGNSFLFALSSASEADVENNLNLLTNRDWMDLAMVYGTGRRAIMTLEKGEDGEQIFADVLQAWAQLDDGAAAAEDASDG